MQHLEVCLPWCIKILSFLCSFNAAATRNTSFLCSFNAAGTWNTAAIKILSLFIVGLIVCLSYLWLRKASHKGFSNLISCLSEHFLQVRLIIQHCFFSVWFDLFMIPGVIISCHLRFHQYSRKTNTDKQTKKSLNFHLSLASRCVHLVFAI